MSIVGVKYLKCFGSKSVRPSFHKLLRMSSNEPCAPDAPDAQKPPQPCQPEPCPPKTEQTPASSVPKGPKTEHTPASSVPKGPKNEQTPASSSPKGPPCPSMPKCPPAICPQVADPNNPCNYCPPPCIDPDYPDLTRLKKLQCFFQKDDETPVYLKKGTPDAFLFQVTVILVVVSLAAGLYKTFKIRNK